VKGKRHTPEQIVRKLREADRLQAEGADVDAVCRHLEVSTRTLITSGPRNGVPSAARGPDQGDGQADARDARQADADDPHARFTTRNGSGPGRPEFI